MIYIGFYRKKVTKIYLVIITLILIVIGLLFNLKKYYIINNNNNYINSYIYVESTNRINITNIKNIDKYLYGIKINDDLSLLVDDDLTGNQIKIYKDMSSTFAKGDILELDINNDNKSLLIKDFYNFDYDQNFIYISKKMYDEVESKSKKYVYVLRLKDWHIIKQFSEELYDNYKIEPSIIINKDNKVDYGNIILVVNIFIYLLITLFVIICIITTYNIIIDEEKNNSLYLYLGYNKRKRINIYFIKVISLYIISLLISIIINCFIYTIFIN